MGKLFKRKRCAEVDYTESMLPHTRKAVFLDVLKLNWAKFVILGSIFFLAVLPMHFISIAETLMSAQASATLQSLQGDAYMAAVLDLYGTKSAAAFLQVPCIVLLFVALAGLSRVIRQYAWEENVRFTTDFWAGIKANIGQTLLLGLLTGLVYAICVYNFYSAMISDSSSMAIVFIPMGVAVLVGIPVAAFAVVNISIYKNSFKNVLYMSLLIFGRAPLKTLLALLCCAAPFAILLIPHIMVMIIGRLLLSVLFPVIFLGWYLFALNLLDSFVNAEMHPELVGKGTVPIGMDVEK